MFITRKSEQLQKEWDSFGFDKESIKDNMEKLIKQHDHQGAFIYDIYEFFLRVSMEEVKSIDGWPTVGKKQWNSIENTIQL